MKKLFFLLALATVLFSCVTVKTNTEKSQKSENTTVATLGSSYENAVIIYEYSESKGVAAEYKWIRENYPNSKVMMQSLTYYKKKPYDIIQIMTADEKSLAVYFDISNFFGKF